MKVTALKVIAFRTPIWKQNSKYQELIINRIKNQIKNGDILIISEKPLSVSIGHIFDESKIKETFLSYLIARFWMRVIWGKCLSIFTEMNRQNIIRLQNYPIINGSKHKQIAFKLKGLFAALKPWSEGGLDVTNLPYTYCASPLDSASTIAENIRRKISLILKKNINIIISDSDKTYLFKNIGLSSRDTEVSGILNLGFLSFILGRKLHLKAYATPIAYSGSFISLKKLLKITSLADKAMGTGSGYTVWDMAKYFDTDITEVTWEMLSKVRHCPIAIIREIKS